MVVGWLGLEICNLVIMEVILFEYLWVRVYGLLKLFFFYFLIDHWIFYEYIINNKYLNI